MAKKRKRAKKPSVDRDLKLSAAQKKRLRALADGKNPDRKIIIIT